MKRALLAPALALTAIALSGCVVSTGDKHPKCRERTEVVEHRTSSTNAELAAIRTFSASDRFAAYKALA